MCAQAAATRAGNVGDWGMGPRAEDWTRGKDLEVVAANDQFVKDDSTYYVPAERPIVVDGKRVRFYYNDMVQDHAYFIPVGGKRYILIKDRMGAIDIYEVVR